MHENVRKLNKNQQQSMLERFDSIQKRLGIENRLSRIDLIDLCTSTTVPSSSHVSSPSSSSPSKTTTISQIESSATRLDVQVMPDSSRDRRGEEPVKKNATNDDHQYLKTLFYSRKYKKFIFDFKEKLKSNSSLMSNCEMLEFLARSILESVKKF